MAKSNEPIWWSLFMAGAGAAALFIPALIVITGIALPFAASVTYDEVQRLATTWPAQVFLFLVISLSLFHWAHRFRYTLIDLGLHGGRSLIAALCYGSAIFGTAVTVWVIWV